MIGRLVQGRGRLAVAAGVRVLGAVLVVVGLVVGIRTLGATQFGISVMVLAAGQILAFPLTALERLVIRLVAQGDHGAARGVLRRASKVGAVVVLGTSIVAGLLAVTHGPDSALIAVACGVSALSAGQVALRQGACRAGGHLLWGQMPNEVFRPVATLISYPLALVVAPSWSGVFSALMASAATLILMLWAPRIRGEAEAPESNVGFTGAIHSLMVVSAVALGVERLYPLVLGATGSPAAVAVFAVVMRIVQLANFTQAFAIFYYSPAMAATLKEGQAHAAPRALSRRVRLLSLLAAAPAVLVCVMVPHVVEVALGSGLTLTTVLPIASLAIAVQALGGPAQTMLVMAGREAPVAGAYMTGAVLSAVAFIAAGTASAVAATTGLVVAFASWNIILVLVARREFGAWH